jgi:hypothetical protein
MPDRKAPTPPTRTAMTKDQEKALDGPDAGDTAQLIGTRKWIAANL